MNEICQRCLYLENEIEKLARDYRKLNDENARLLCELNKLKGDQDEV